MCTNGKLIRIWMLVIAVGFVCQYCDGLRVLGIFAYKGKSHYIMGERLMKALAAKGHQVDSYTHFPQKKALPNLTDYSLVSDLEPDIKDNVTYSQLLKLIENWSSVKYWIASAGSHMCDYMDLPVFQELLRNPPQDPPYDVIVCDICLAYCLIAWSYHLKIPIINVVMPAPYDWIFTSHGNPINYAAESYMFSPAAVPMTFFERLDNWYTGVKTDLTFKYYAKKQNQLVERIFGKGYPDVVDMGKDIAISLINYDHNVHGARPLVPSIVPIGGLHVDDSNETLPESLQKWLDESKDGFVYFSFGSSVRIETFPGHLLDVFYKAFASIAPTRVLWRIVKPEELPPNLPKNVRVEKWLAQAQILKHKNIKAFVTHGGMMSTYEAVYNSVPVVAVPFFVDQYVNADLYVKKNIGLRIHLKDINVDAFARVLNEIIKNPVYKRNMVKLSKKIKDRPMSPLETSIYWVEYIARHGKDAVRSPVNDMTWWQASLFDVYAFVAGIAGLTLLVTYKGLALSIRFYKSNKRRCFDSKLKKN